jgi:hypothetical protein
MNPKDLRSVLVDAATALDRTGEATWQRASDWIRPGFPPSSGERGGGPGPGQPSEQLTDRRDDQAAGRYFGELVTISDRVAKDLARLSTIQTICNPATNVEPCVACGQPIDTRRNGQKYYATMCRRCGAAKACNR